MLNTELLVTVSGGESAVLAILKEAFDSNAFVQFILEMEALSYLIQDPSTVASGVATKGKGE